MSSKDLISSSASAASVESCVAILSEDPLTELRSLHDEVTCAARLSLASAIRIGELLCQLKERCGHGKWLEFVELNLPFAERTAQNYIKLHTQREALKSANFADLPISQACLLLAKPASRQKVNSPAAQGNGKVETKRDTTATRVPASEEVLSQPCENESPKDSWAAAPESSLPLENAADSAKEHQQESPAEHEIPASKWLDVEEMAGDAEEDSDQREKPLFNLSDGTPVLESEWRSGVIELQDVRNDLLARFKRNAEAPAEKKYPPAALLLAERLIMEGGKTLNTFTPAQPGPDELASFNEAVNFLGDRLRLAASMRGPSIPPVSTDTE